ncbi:MAG: NAD(P)/FAD-dependent oxidoreductase [Acidimicrobiales bacterium]|nr:NAD(P)/FAD-dependent oxidoreductase [Acidimicrobiales bacterium]
MSTTAETELPDLDAIRARYAAERDKRLRADGPEQYIQVKDDHVHFQDDPWSDDANQREPLTDEVEVLVVGAGFGGLVAGARLRQQGVDSIRFVDPAADFGGTWYWNRYPGIACDVESYIYLPLLEEVGYVPKNKYAYGSEIREHCMAIAETFDLYRDTCFGTRATELRWDDEISRWRVRTDRGDDMRAKFICLALGQLSKPKLPGLEGIEEFAGHSFHTSRWDYDYTGGDADGGLTGLAGKRVGVIGTGASAVQVVPHVAESAEHLYVFQRTPSIIDVKDNPPTDPDWAASLQSGWHKHRRDNFNALVSGVPQEEDLVDDGWTDMIGNLMKRIQSGKAQDFSPEGIQEMLELADLQKMESIRGRVDEFVDDPETAEALKPYYRQFCKRPCIHEDYLPTFNRDNVTLVDTDGQGVDRVTSKGLVVDGEEYELDLIIYASGFEVGTPLERRSGFDMIGRTGKTLTQTWTDGLRSLHGMHMHGFPNTFLMSIGQAANVVNYTHLLDEQATHLSYIVARAREDGLETVEVTADAEASWVEQCIEKVRERGGAFFTDCTPGYYNNEGLPRSSGSGPYGVGPGVMEFLDLLEAWRESGDLEGLRTT